MQRQKLITTILVLALARLFNNITRRFAYPFIPAIGRELDVSSSAVGSVIATQGGMGILSPAFGPVSEKYGRKNTLLFALVLMIMASLPGIVAPVYGVFYFAMVVFGLSKIIFDPAMQAYIGDLVPYQFRGRAIGTTELAWAGSLIVAAPMTGFLLDRFGLSAVFIMIVVLSMAGFLLIWRYVPTDIPDRATKIPNFFESLQIMRGSPIALAVIGFILFYITANEFISISYARWMESEFDLKVTALGTAAVVIALAEVTGEFVVIGIADRFGKKRLTLVGLVGTTLSYVLLTQMPSLTTALMGMFMTFLFFETAVVASIPMITEILPHARAVMLSSAVAATSIARFSGGIIGGQLYERGNFTTIGLAAAALTLAAVVVMGLFVHENHSSSTMGVTWPAESSVTSPENG